MSAEASKTAYYTYILRCGDSSLYTGITTDLARRFAEHSGRGGKGAKYTAARRLVRFEAARESPGRAEASKLEYQLKALTKPEKEWLIHGETPNNLDLSLYTRIRITNNGGIIMLFVCYPKCSTCQKARAFLDAKGAAYDSRDIKAANPTEAELRIWHAKSGLPLKRFFNTSGLQYKALELSKRLPSMTEDEQFALLATDGMLVKRPILVGGDFVLVAFKEAEWEEKLCPGESLSTTAGPTRTPMRTIPSTSLPGHRILGRSCGIRATKRALHSSMSTTAYVLISSASRSAPTFCARSIQASPRLTT